MSTLLKFSGLALIYVANAKDFVTFDELDGIAASPQKMFNDQDSKLHKFELQSAKQGWKGFIKKLKHPGPLLSVCSGKTGPELNQCYDQNGLRGDKVIALRSKIENLKSEELHGVDAIKSYEKMMAGLRGNIANYYMDKVHALSDGGCCADATEMNEHHEYGCSYKIPTWDQLHQAGYKCVYRCHTGPGAEDDDILDGFEVDDPDVYRGAANIDNGRDQLCLYREGTDIGNDVRMIWWGPGSATRQPVGHADVYGPEHPARKQLQPNYLSDETWAIDAHWNPV